MKVYVWDDEKNKWLQESRVFRLRILLQQSIPEIYSMTSLIPIRRVTPHQRMKIVKWKNYAYAVAYIEDEQKYFLKTAYPSRTAKRKYVKRKEFYEKDQTRCI